MTPCGKVRERFKEMFSHRAWKKRVLYFHTIATKSFVVSSNNLRRKGAMKLESKRDLKMEYFKCSKKRKGELLNEARSMSSDNFQFQLK